VADWGDGEKKIIEHGQDIDHHTIILSIICCTKTYSFREKKIYYNSSITLQPLDKQTNKTRQKHNFLGGTYNNNK